MNASTDAKIEFLSDLPLRYRLFTPVDRLLSTMGSVQVRGKHPFMILRNRLNQSAYQRLLTVNKNYLTTTKNEFLIHIPLNDQAAASILSMRHYCPDECMVLLKLLSRCSAFLDVGANLGYFTLLALKEFGDRGRVIAVEPNDALCRLIVESMKANTFTSGKVIQAAVGEASGTARFQMNTCLSSNSHVIGADQQKSSLDRVVEVQMVTIDEILSTESPSLEWLIKIDVEGLEVSVLKGATSALKKGAIVMCEIFRDSIDELQQLTQDHGYLIVD